MLFAKKGTAVQASAGETVTGRSKVYWATGVWFNKSVLALKSPDTTHGVRMSVQGRANNFEGSAWHHYVKNMNMFVLPIEIAGIFKSNRTSCDTKTCRSQPPQFWNNVIHVDDLNTNVA